MSIVLMVKDEGETKSYILNRTPIVAGRSSSCEIQLNNPLCSGEHCQFGLTATGQAMVMDLGSTNGIAVNNSKTQSCKLFLDDEIYIGEALAWLDEEQMTQLEKHLHTKEGIKPGRHYRPEIKLPKNNPGKTGQLLSSASKSKSNLDRTSTAVRNVRKARAAKKKDRN